MDVAKGKEVYGPSRDPKFASSIVEYLDEPRDVVSFSLVCKTFLHIAIKKIWTKPELSSRTSFDSFLSTLSSPHHTVPYTSFITTINLNAFPDITDDQFRLLVACENLAHLDMRMCQNISAATLQHTFSQFHRLKGVDLEGISSITDDVMLSLARNNPHLRGVKLGKCSPGHWVLSDAGVIALGDYCGDSLREVYLHLPSLSLVTSVALRCLITRCPRLQTLDIAHGRSVDDGVVRLVWQSVGQTLRKLNLAGCSELTDVMLPPPAPSVHDTHPRDPAVRPLPPIPKAPRLLAPSLREIDLTDCKRLTDYAIELICTNAPKLRNLNLKGCRQLTDASLYSVAKLGSSLQQINVAKLSEITDKGVNAISEGCRKLANIDLSECSKLTNSCVVSLSRLSRIESLRLNRNENITDVGVMSLATPGISSSLKRIHLSFCTNVTAFSVHHLLSVHRQITFVSVSGIPDFLDDPALLKLSKPVDRGWKPETFRVYATPGSIAKLRKVLSKRKSAPNANTGGIVSGLETAIPPTSACAQPATSSPESGPAFALLAAKLEHIQRPVSPVQPELGSRPKDAIVCAGLGTGSVTRQTTAAPDMNSEKVSPEASKRSHRSRKGRTEKGTMTLVTSPEPPPLESSAGAGIKPQSRSPPSQPQPSPVPSYPPPPPPPLAQPQARAQAPLPSSKLLENSPISIETSPLRQGPQVNGAAQVHPLLIQKKASITIAGAETAAATGLVIEEKGGASDHHHLSGSISSFEDLEDEGSEYDFLDNKSDLESIAASVELGSGTESGHEDDDDDIVNIGHGQAAARPTLGNTLPTTGNERRESGGKGEDGVKSGVFSDDEEDFECVEMPEV